jgi:SAM-dependent methyltransferase
MSNGWGKLNPCRVKTVSRYAQGSVLDVGCAEGQYVYGLRSRKVEAYGVDIESSPKWVDAPDGVFRQADICDLPFGNQAFDTLLTFEVLEHVDDYQRALRELRRVCNKILLASVPNARMPDILREAGLTYHHWVDRSHIHFFNEDTIKCAVEKAGFSVDTIEGFNDIRPGLVLFSAMRMPKQLATALSYLCSRIPWYRRYPTSLMIRAH